MEIYICELSELEGISATSDVCDTPYVYIDCKRDYPNGDYYSIIIKDGKVYAHKSE